MNTLARAAEVDDHPALRPFPSKLFVETTTRCNLRCRMCVKQAADGVVPEGDLLPRTFDALAPAFPNVESLVLSGVGEPLLHPLLEDFIRRAKLAMGRDGRVGFQSNGLLLDRSRACSLLCAGLDRLCLSVDSVSPSTFRAIREGADVGALDLALEAMAKAKRETDRSA